MRTYEKPDVPAPRLHAAQQSNVLTPETDVTVIFRGGPPICDMYDSRDYTVPPCPEGVPRETWRHTIQPASYWTLSYAVAQHLRDRAIVPATRDPHNYKRAMSQLGIVGIDPPDRCTAFTEAQLQKFEYTEGLDRSQFLDSRSKVTVVETKDAVAHALSKGRDVDTELEAEPESTAIQPPEEHEGLREIQQAEREVKPAPGEPRYSRTRRGPTRFDDER